MPLGRLITSGDLNEVAERGIGGERIYLKGQFVVNFSDANKAVLRPRTRLASAMLHLGNASTRIIVEFPAGYVPPAQGSVVSRDEARPLEITEAPAGRRPVKRFRARNYAGNAARVRFTDKIRYNSHIMLQNFIDSRCNLVTLVTVLTRLATAARLPLARH
jgi:hypothetical protein